MPEYNYICPNCDEHFAVTRSISEYDSHEKCPKCGEPSDRNFKVNYCNGNYIVNTDGFYGKKSN